MRPVILIALKTILLALLVPGTMLVLVPYLLLSRELELYAFDFGVFRLAGLPLILTGAVMAGWCAKAFVSKGRGTPAPFDPPKFLVVQGLYRYVRNPMYVGAATILFGEALVFQSATLFAYTALLLTFFHLFVVYYEEPALKRLFGADYDRYFQSTPRWIPRFKRG